MRHSRAFTLLELVVVLTIAIALMGTVMPVLSGIVRSTRVDMAAGRTEAALQYNVVLARKMKCPDFQSIEPRIPNARYFGTALVFDETSHKAWFTVNMQSAVFDSAKPPQPSNLVEWQTDPDFPAGQRKAYVRLKGDEIEHADLPTDLVYFGIAWDQATGSLTLTPTPFAVCASGIGGGLPQRAYVDVDLALTDPATNQPLYTPATGCPHGGFDNPNYPLSPSGQRRVPTTLPWILVVPRSHTVQTGWSTDWDRATQPWAAFKAQIPNPQGTADDAGRIQALLTQARARLVTLTIGGGTNVHL